MDIRVKLSELKDYILGIDRDGKNNEKKTGCARAPLYPQIDQNFLGNALMLQYSID